ncbi:hypothetical protein G6F42_017294 [Rhizopus arrhizus]|nr:hypothetical protein G6F42_017294 [Rhizopus arrhizus]
MKLSFSLALLAAAAISVQAAVTPNAASSCVAGSSGLGNGDGYNGYCCKTSDDCFESCVKGVCNGPTKPTKPTKTSTAQPSSTPGTCTAGSSGLGKGDGYNGYCCKSSDDCFESCVKGVCNGPSNTKSPTPVPTGTNCKPGYKGLGNGEGPANACCDDSDDCQESCISGKCN